MLGQMERKLSTSAKSEAAARMSRERLSRNIIDTGQKLQRPLSAQTRYGFATPVPTRPLGGRFSRLVGTGRGG